MRLVSGMLVLGLTALPIRALEAPEGCAWLCGKWATDTTRSESAEPAVDSALQKFKEPRPRKPPRPRFEDPPGPDGPADVAPVPVPETTGKTALRTQLLTALAPPASLAISAQADVILIRAGDNEERRLYPGEPHSRVSAQGTTKISTEWRKDALVVREDRGGKRKSTETYTLLADGSLQLTRVLENPGLKPLRLSTIYRRGQTQGGSALPAQSFPKR